jgi:predicted mannosyl-3-phosphoglycerate phosphatase (HAD superfamily)
VATKALRALYVESGPPPFLAGFGDAPNDAPMLDVVDEAVIVASYDPAVTAALRSRLPGARVTRAKGPAGWAEAVIEVLVTWESRNPVSRRGRGHDGS